MHFYETYFTKSFIYTYIADLCRGFSSNLVVQKDVYEEVKKIDLKSHFNIQLYKQTTPVATDTTLIIVPYRSSSGQNRSKQLDAFIKHYSSFKVLVVEQREFGKFNRGALLNCGYDYAVSHYPEMNTFIMHDVDILMDSIMLKNYYGQDDHDIVHMGLCVKGEKYKGDPKKSKFLGRVIRFSKEMYKKINGFPNTFYGWGGEDDAIAFRMEKNTLFRPNETDTGEEMQTENDIIDTRDPERVETHKKELVLLDTLQWKINGLNSLHYEVESNSEINDMCRKIIVNLSPHINYDMEIYKLPPSIDVSPPFIPSTDVSPFIPSTPITESEPEDLSGELEVIAGSETLNPVIEETKIIHL
jgi:hypothetical protein